MSQDTGNDLRLDDTPQNINDHEHVYVCQDCHRSQEEVNDLVAPKPLASKGVANPPNPTSINEILEGNNT